MIQRSLLLLGFGLAVFAAPVSAAVIGQNVPSQSVTAKRVMDLPEDVREAWQAYLQRSALQKKIDKKALAAERKGMKKIPPLVPSHNNDTSMPLDNDPAWYGGPEAKIIAGNIVSFQTPAGGWGKNQDRNAPPRLKGQAYVTGNNTSHPTPGNFDIPDDPDWHYVGTLDNNATTREIWFLARVARALPGPEGDVYRASFVKGLRYLIAAQYPNGGWPQTWPLEGGYHDAITYNDNAVSQAAEVMTAVSTNEDGLYNFVPGELRAAAAVSAKKALEIILATQVKNSAGVLTIWGQQHDALTLKPSSARNFEPALLASDESASMLRYLMALPNPDARLQVSVHAGIAYLKKVAVMDVTLTSRTGPEGIKLVAKPGAGPLWARYTDPDTGQAVFGDRDKSLHDDMNELTLERRNGYHYYVESPEKAIADYAAWSKKYPPAP